MTDKPAAPEPSAAAKVVAEIAHGYIESDEPISFRFGRDCYDAGAASKEQEMAAEIERLQQAVALVNEQANDDGLWFHAETAPEAYLQRQLRLLHSTIEGRTGRLDVTAAARAALSKGE